MSKGITKDMTIAEAVERNERAGAILMSIGMHCLGCAMAHGETVEEAAQVHNVDVDKLIALLNQ
ncbi:MAG: DUF1858 domain-containing protein [Clostridia bacterium]|nr:DUF1858 domain-containing protein [Clostridia bacterium]MBR2160496.1 DUF1858 domain-containing protein [Clostridia bacterium]MBR2397692.1 DUF1858 domain-containing protein [Clostridia bacterium]MBR2496696.1 DUF1858 domain-containing protein [Clostridia bacterium]